MREVFFLPKIYSSSITLGRPISNFMCILSGSCANIDVENIFFVRNNSSFVTARRRVYAVVCITGCLAIPVLFSNNKLSDEFRIDYLACEVFVI